MIQTNRMCLVIRTSLSPLASNSSFWDMSCPWYLHVLENDNQFNPLIKSIHACKPVDSLHALLSGLPCFIYADLSIFDNCALAVNQFYNSKILTMFVSICAPAHVSSLLFSPLVPSKNPIVKTWKTTLCALLAQSLGRQPSHERLLILCALNGTSNKSAHLSYVYFILLWLIDASF